MRASAAAAFRGSNKPDTGRCSTARRGHIGYNLLAPAGVQALPSRQTSGGHAREVLERV
jgi:hypothetical protein